MIKTDALIIGGSAAGLVAGITIRRHYPDAKITLVRKEEQVLIPCGIPYIFGTVGSTDNNLIPDAALSKNGIDLIVDEVTSIDREAKTVATAGGETIGYEKLFLGTGSTPLVPPLPGVDLEGVFSIKKDVPYLNNLLAALDKAQDVVVIGGGFIGLEMADECKKRGLNVTVVEMLPHCLFLVFDEHICMRMEEALAERGIKVMTNNQAMAILGDGKVKGVKLSSGEELEADVVIFGIGVRPNVKLAQDAGLKIGERRDIWVDRYMRTSDDDIFAAGDCAGKTDFITNRPSGLRLASIATTEARIAGANFRELRRESVGAIGVFSTKVGNLAMGMAGMRAKAARDAGLDVVVGTAETINRHPGGMPGAAKMRVDLVFHKWSCRLIGGQVSGGDSVGEFVNVIATAIAAGATADEIATFQVGTHPALTASPIAYPLVNAAEMALKQMR